ncbi:MAG: phosphoribosylglycinamide formyltransferase [Granulosicoccus sp.]|nr:phosphoribosylglycinamide formyltransferase [Granulosicoccus sp.]
MSEASSSVPGQQPTLAILISGRGSNMLAIAKACQTGQLAARVSLVVSNRPEAAGIAAASALGLDTAVIDHTAFDSRRDFDQALHERLLVVRPDWIVLAGFMRILTRSFVERWEGRILNIHPSLLPRYPGLDTHARAIAAGDSHAGASVHIVSPELDAGPVIAQVQVPILPDDTTESLAQRVLKEEHTLYIQALQQCVGRHGLASLLP